MISFALAILFILSVVSPGTGFAESEALKVYDILCRKGSATSCFLFEDSLRTGGFSEEKEKVFTEACDQGDPYFCFRLAMLYDDDGGLPVDGKAAFELYSSACEAGYFYSCARAAVFYEVSVPSKEPGARHKAALLYLKACKAGFAGPCLSASLLVPEKSEKNDKKSRSELRELACQRGSVQACLLLAREVLPDPVFYCDSCSDDSMDPRCSECEIARCCKKNCCPECIGKNYACCEFCKPLAYPETKPVLDPDRDKKFRQEALTFLEPAVEMLGEACELGYGRACAKLGDLYEENDLPLFDPGLAKDKYRLACKLGIFRACD